MGSRKLRWILALGLLLAPLLAACGRPVTVTLYTDGDKAAVQKLVEPYTKRTGHRVTVVHFEDARYLVEAIRHRSGGKVVTTPHNSAYGYADVILSTEKDTGEALLALNGLREFDAEAAGVIPAGAMKDGWWYGMGGRAWVLMWNTGLTDKQPAGLLDLAGDGYPKGSVAMVNPNNILYYPCGAAAILGSDKVSKFLLTMAERGTQWLANPADTSRLVAEGKATVCLTTLAEANHQKENGAPVDWVLPDQGTGRMGAYVQYNVVAVSAVSKMPEEAKALADYLLEADTEKLCVTLGLADVALRPYPGLTSATPLKTNLASAQQGMQGIGETLTRFANMTSESNKKK